MFSGADAREDSIDSFRTDEEEIANDKHNESTSKPEVEDVREKKSEEKKKEPLAKKSEEKKEMKHHPVRSTIQIGTGATRGLAKPSGIKNDKDIKAGAPLHG
jgi:hypothetical protein